MREDEQLTGLDVTGGILLVALSLSLILLIIVLMATIGTGA